MYFFKLYNFINIWQPVEYAMLVFRNPTQIYKLSVINANWPKYVLFIANRNVDSQASILQA